jgi:integrase
VRSRRERFASPAEAAELIVAAPEEDRPVWATALYTGLRRGELMALRWNDVDFDAGTIHVRHAWDLEHGP